jgi:hypothetical protein
MAKKCCRLRRRCSIWYAGGSYRDSGTVNDETEFTESAAALIPLIQEAGQACSSALGSAEGRSGRPSEL